MKRILPPHARMRQIQENARRDRGTKPTAEEIRQRDEVAPVPVLVDASPEPEPAPVLPPLSVEDMVTPPPVEQPVEPETVPEPALEPVEEPVEEVAGGSVPEVEPQISEPQDEVVLFDPVGLSLTEIKANKRDALNAVATSLGIDVSEMKNKTEVAEAIFNLVNGK